MSKRRRDQADSQNAVDAVAPPPSKLPKTGSGPVIRVENPVSQGTGPSGPDELSSGESGGPTNNTSSPSTSDPPTAVDYQRPASPTGTPCRRQQAATMASDEETAEGPELVIEWVSPEQGPTTGGRNVFILGSNFPTDQMPLYASFGDNFTRAVRCSYLLFG